MLDAILMEGSVIVLTWKSRIKVVVMAFWQLLPVQVYIKELCAWALHNFMNAAHYYSKL